MSKQQRMSIDEKIAFLEVLRETLSYVKNSRDYYMDYVGDDSGESKGVYAVPTAESYNFSKYQAYTRLLEMVESLQDEI